MSTLSALRLVLKYSAFGRTSFITLNHDAFKFARSSRNMAGVYRNEDRLTLRMFASSSFGGGFVEPFKAGAGLDGAVSKEAACRLNSR